MPMAAATRTWVTPANEIALATRLAGGPARRTAICHGVSIPDAAKQDVRCLRRAAAGSGRSAVGADAADGVVHPVEAGVQWPDGSEAGTLRHSCTLSSRREAQYLRIRSATALRCSSQKRRRGTAETVPAYRRGSCDSTTPVPVLSRYSTAACIWAAFHSGHARPSGNPDTPARRPRATAATAASCEPCRSHNARNRIVVSIDGSESS